MKRLAILLFVLLQAGLAWPLGSRAARFSPQAISLPPGFQIALFADNVEKARSITSGPDGVIFVGTRDAGKVYALVDRDGDFRAERMITLAEGLSMPNGVAFRNGDLYVAEVDRVIRFDRIMAHLAAGAPFSVVNDSFPDKHHHGWKFIRFGPDGKLYIPVGAPCNVCLEKDRRFATIMRMNTDGSGLEVFAEGVRNSVGFDWHPQTHELWFTDNGRDWLGDDFPPDELNRAPAPVRHFGFPFYHGNNVPDPVFGDQAPKRVYYPPARLLGPHVASLGMRFYTGEMFPPDYYGQIFIAEHGSWNRSQPIGYRITRVRLQDGEPASYEVFAQGWLSAHGIIGRPVDLEILRDGSMLVSDDYAGRIYRVTFSGTAK
jgi:glucose/arabinose dehydrogenase